MTTQTPTRRDVQRLLGEASRYLAAVDAFRAEGCEPSWRPEWKRSATRSRARRVVVPPIA